jgi:hypothetical protein
MDWLLVVELDQLWDLELASMLASLLDLESVELLDHARVILLAWLLGSSLDSMLATLVMLLASQ